MEQSLNRIEVNNINGGSNRELSSGRGAHDQQLNLDLYQATAGKHKIEVEQNLSKLLPGMSERYINQES